MKDEQKESPKKFEEAADYNLTDQEADRRPYTINYERALNKLSPLPPETRKYLLPNDTTVPVSVYIDGERQWIGSVSVAGSQGAISLFTDIPEDVKQAFNNGLWEVVLTPREQIKLPQKTQLAQEDDR